MTKYVVYSSIEYIHVLYYYVVESRSDVDTVKKLYIIIVFSEPFTRRNNYNKEYYMKG